MLSRRSFIALVASTLAVKPARLLPPAAGPSASSVFMPYQVWDSLTLSPGDVSTGAEFSALPEEFFISGLSWAVDSSIPLRDYEALLETVGLRLSMAGRDYLRVPLFALPAAPASPLVMVPEVLIAGSKSFSLGLGSLLPVCLSAPVAVMVVLNGRVRAYD